MEILIATSNQGKIRELRDILKPKNISVTTLADYKITLDVEENGETFFDNALLKAKAISKVVGKPVLADDSGLIVNALNGEPGVHSARYAGDIHDDKANITKLLKSMENVIYRTEYFTTVLVLLYPDGSYKIGEGRVDGHILENECGSNGFGYDPVFYCDELKKSFGEATNIEKESVSHRARAVKNLLVKL